MLTKLQTLREEREEGFTLIELLVVILIIGILSAIAIPAFMNQRKSAVDASVESDLSSIAKALADAQVKNPMAPIENQVISYEGGVSQLAFIQASKLMITDQNPKVSKGNLVHVYGTEQAGEFCIIGVNLNGDRAKDGIFYDSAKGGLNNSGGACADDNSDNVADRTPEVVSAAENLKGNAGGGAVETPGENVEAGEGSFTHSGVAVFETNDADCETDCYASYTYTTTVNVLPTDSSGNITTEIRIEFSSPISSIGTYDIYLGTKGGSREEVTAFLGQIENGVASGTVKFAESDGIGFDRILAGKGMIKMDGGWISFNS